MDGLADPNREDRIMLFATVRSGQSGGFGCFRSALVCSTRKAALPLKKMLGIDPILRTDLIDFLFEPGIELRPKCPRFLPRSGMSLRECEGDEGIEGTPAKKLASPKSEPGQFGRGSPVGEGRDCKGVVCT